MYHYSCFPSPEPVISCASALWPYRSHTRSGTTYRQGLLQQYTCLTRPPARSATHRACFPKAVGGPPLFCNDGPTTYLLFSFSKQLLVQQQRWRLNSYRRRHSAAKPCHVRYDDSCGTILSGTEADRIS